MPDRGLKRRRRASDDWTRGVDGGVSPARRDCREDRVRGQAHRPSSGKESPVSGRLSLKAAQLLLLLLMFTSTFLSL